MTASLQLSARQKAILQCVRNNPDSTIKERIIKTLTDEALGSRKTILKDIKILEEYGMVYIHKKKPNSQVHYVMIRNDSILLRMTEDLEHFKKNFSSLVEAAKRVINDERWNKDDYDEVDGVRILNERIVKIELSLQTLFEHFIGIYMLYSVLDWPTRLDDRRALDRLHAIVFEMIKEIRLELSELPQLPNLFIGDIIEQLFILKPHKLHRTVEDLKASGLGQYAEPVLDSLWQSSLPFVPDGVLYTYRVNEKMRKRNRKFIDKWKLRDWRNVVKLRDRWNKTNVQYGSLVYPYDESRQMITKNTY
jgi:hypothetical protein